MLVSLWLSVILAWYWFISSPLGCKLSVFCVVLIFILYITLWSQQVKDGLDDWTQPRPRLFIFYRDCISQKKQSNIFINKNSEISLGKILDPKLPPMSEWFNKWIIVLWECGLETWQIMQACLPITFRRQNVQRQEIIRWHGEYSTMPFSHVRESRKSYEAWRGSLDPDLMSQWLCPAAY